jgi:hypothetical protein
MKNKSVRIFVEELGTKAKITVSRKVKEIHPVVKHIVDNLAELDFIHFIRVSPEILQASNEITEGRIKIPVSKTDHPTAIGVYLIIDIANKDIHFYEMNSAIKGCGGKMVDAVLKALPQDWNGVVVMDWSNGFWDKMKEKHRNLYIL